MQIYVAMKADAYPPTYEAFVHKAHAEAFLGNNPGVSVSDTSYVLTLNVHDTCLVAAARRTAVDEAAHRARAIAKLSDAELAALGVVVDRTPHPRHAAHNVID